MIFHGEKAGILKCGIVCYRSMMSEPERQLLSRFPKVRPTLPPAYQRIYDEHYIRNRTGGSPATFAARMMEAWMHRKVAEDTRYLQTPYRTLEIGSGNLNHIPYEPRSKPYDVVEPFETLAASSPENGNVSRVYRDIGEIHETRYNRILSIAAFEHMADLPTIVATCGQLLLPGGQLRVAIPSEGTLLWGLGWRMTTGIEFRLRHHLDYGVLMRHEHLNDASEIAAILGVFFETVKCEVLGVNRALSFYQFFRCSSPRTGKCSRYLTRERTI